MKRFLCFALCIIMIFSITNVALATSVSDLSIDLVFVLYNVENGSVIEDLGSTVKLSDIKNTNYQIRIAADITNKSSDTFYSSSLKLSDGTGRTATFENDSIEAKTGYYYTSSKLSEYNEAGTYNASITIDGKTVFEKSLLISGGGLSLSDLLELSLPKFSCETQMIEYVIGSGNYYQDLSDTIDLAAIPSDHYASAALLVKNTGEKYLTASVSAEISGVKFNWKEQSIESNKSTRFSFTQTSMKECGGYAEGNHEIKWYVNGNLAATQSYTIENTGNLTFSPMTNYIMKKFGVTVEEWNQQYNSQCLFAAVVILDYALNNDDVLPPYNQYDSYYAMLDDHSAVVCIPIDEKQYSLILFSDQTSEYQICTVGSSDVQNESGFICLNRLDIESSIKTIVELLSDSSERNLEIMVPVVDHIEDQSINKNMLP